MSTVAYSRDMARAFTSKPSPTLACVFGSALLALLAACTGSTGAQGPAGAAGATGPQGPPGPPGAVTALNVSTAQSMTATITSVSVPAAPPVQPVVKFTLVNQIGQPLSGLKAANVYFAVAKLVPPGTQLKAVPPQTAAPAPSLYYQWQSYIYTTANPACAPAPCTTTTPPGLPVTGTTSQPQATVEFGTGKFVDNGNGTYQYTFTKDISSDPAVSYDPTLTHRVGFEIRGLAPANSPVYTFQPSSGATTNIPTNAIVDDQTCLNCHQQLAFHGGARTEVRYCVMCHNPSSLDPSTGNTLDFKVMFHKIHMGANLPSVIAGGHYYIFGYMNSINDYSGIVFPTDPTGPDTCATCHNESDPATPDTVNWRNTPAIAPCTSCHDNIDFTKGTNHGGQLAPLGPFTDNDCATCHGPNSSAAVTAGGSGTGGPQISLQVAAVHANLSLDTTVTPNVPRISTQGVINYSKQFAYTINSVSLAGPTPTVNFTVTDPTMAGHTWNILTDAPFTGANCPTASIGMILGWPTTDFTNTGSSVASEAQPLRTSVTCNAAVTPVAGPNGSFTVSLPAAATLPGGLKAAGVMGSAGILIDGFPAHDFGDGQGPMELIVPSAVSAGAITDATAVPRRTVVDIAKCDKCHDVLNAHGNHRVDNVQSCGFCHNPNATDIAARKLAGVTAANAPDGATEQPIDLKYMIHALHDGNVRAATAPYVVYHCPEGMCFFDDFRSITPFPGALNNCNGCHVPNSGADQASRPYTFYPQDPTASTSLATTVNSNDNSTSPAGQLAITAAAAACSACHVDSLAKTHMQQNGANFAAVKDANSHVASSETCVVCHGPGAIADVAVVHNLSQYQ